MQLYYYYYSILNSITIFNWNCSKHNLNQHLNLQCVVFNFIYGPSNSKVSISIGPQLSCTPHFNVSSLQYQILYCTIDVYILILFFLISSVLSIPWFYLSLFRNKTKQKKNEKLFTKLGLHFYFSILHNILYLLHTYSRKCLYFKCFQLNLLRISAYDLNLKSYLFFFLFLLFFFLFLSMPIRL